jgi:alpha-tubulin suppressor-like RCC1 family protein
MVMRNQTLFGGGDFTALRRCARACPQPVRRRNYAVRSKLIRKIPSLIALTAIFALAPLLHASNHVVAWGAGTYTNLSDPNVYGQSAVPPKLTNAVLVAGGWRHSLALNANGTLTGWGDNQLNQTAFPAGSNYMAIACGYWHSLALRTNGTVVAAGDDTYGQTAIPANLTNVVAVTCGWYHNLALKSDGTVVGWGAGSGVSNNIQDYGQSKVPAGLSNVVAIAAGGWHSLALKADGTLTGWGRNDSRQASVPTSVSNVVAVAAAAAATLVLESSGKLVAWGDNSDAQTNIPTGLTNGFAVAAIAAGGWHFLALKTNGTVISWGATDPYVNYGQTNVPNGLTNVIQIAAGLFHSLALVGTNPPEMKARLNIANLGTNGFAIAWPTRNGRVYRLEYTSTLANPIWSAFPLQAGLDGTNRFTDTNRLSSQRFYRIRRW